MRCLAVLVPSIWNCLVSVRYCHPPQPYLFDRRESEPSFIIPQECFLRIICVLHYEELMGFFSPLNAVCKCHQNVISAKLKVAVQWKLV